MQVWPLSWLWGIINIIVEAIRRYLQSYDLSWGQGQIDHAPAVGNHEYLTSGGTDCNTANAGATGYFNYFGAAAGQPWTGILQL